MCVSVDQCQLCSCLCVCECDFFVNFCLEPAHVFIHACMCQPRYGQVHRQCPDDGPNDPTSLWAEAETQCWQSCWLDGACSGAVKCTAVIYTHRQGLRVWSGLISPVHQAMEQPDSCPGWNFNWPKLKESNKWDAHKSSTARGMHVNGPNLFLIISHEWLRNTF